jgi:uncharacterized membrane protein YkoI
VNHQRNEETDMTKRTVGFVLGTLGIVGTLAFGAGIIGSAIAAGSTNPVEESAGDVVKSEPAAPSPGLSMEQVTATLSKQGYREVDEIERKGGVYEVKARAEDGHKVEMYMDSKTGEILHHEADD